MKGPKSRCEHAATQSDRDGRVEAWIWLGIAVVLRGVEVYKEMDVCSPEMGQKFCIRSLSLRISTHLPSPSLDSDPPICTSK